MAGGLAERVGKQTVEKKTHLTPANRNECGKILWMEKASFLSFPLLSVSALRNRKKGKKKHTEM